MRKGIKPDPGCDTACSYTPHTPGPLGIGRTGDDRHPVTLGHSFPTMFKGSAGRRVDLGGKIIRYKQYLHISPCK